MIKVLIVDDQELFRESLKVVLGVSENIRVTDAVPGVSQALKSAERERPDVVLMDIRMPGMDGIEGTRLFKKRWPDVKIIVLTTFDDELDAMMAYNPAAVCIHGELADELYMAGMLASTIIIYLTPARCIKIGYQL